MTMGIAVFVTPWLHELVTHRIDHDDRAYLETHQFGRKRRDYDLDFTFISSPLE